MIDVILYSFAKEADSTAIPKPANGVSYACELKDVCSILSPSLVFHMVDGWTPAQINYIHIPIWSRYYFASWTWQNGLWIADCAVDVLASWRTEIGNSAQYVLRSASEYDEFVPDGFYSAKAGITMDRTVASFPWTSNLVDGTYVIGVINGDENARGGTSYYVLTQSYMSALRDALFINTDYLQIPSSEISSELAKTLFNPFQYIVSCKWFPFVAPTEGDLQASIKVGWWTLPVNCKRLAKTPIFKDTWTLDVPQHPQAATRGGYLNGSPYTRLTYNYGPWGDVAIAPDFFVRGDAKALTVSTLVDCVSGNGISTFSAGSSEILRTAASVGVDIQLSQVTMSMFDSIASGVTGLLAPPPATAAGQGIMGAVKAGVRSWSNYGNIASGFAQAAINEVVPTSTPTVQTLSASGSIAAYQLPPVLRADFSILVDNDNARAGRPLCAVRNIKSLSGFIMCQNPELHVVATAEEHDAIISFLRGGFYYE